MSLLTDLPALATPCTKSCRYNYFPSHPKRPQFEKVKNYNIYTNLALVDSNLILLHKLYHLVFISPEVI